MKLLRVRNKQQEEKEIRDDAEERSSDSVPSDEGAYGKSGQKAALTKIKKLKKRDLQQKLLAMESEHELFKEALKDQKACIEKLEAEKAEEEEKSIISLNKELETQQALDAVTKEKEDLKLKLAELEQRIATTEEDVSEQPQAEKNESGMGEDNGNEENFDVNQIEEEVPEEETKEAETGEAETERDAANEQTGEPIEEQENDNARVDSSWQHEEENSLVKEKVKKSQASPRGMEGFHSFVMDKICSCA